MRLVAVLALLVAAADASAQETGAACRGPGPLPGACGARNVQGRPLEPCRSRLSTGFFRDGYCRTDAHDRGVHVVCAEVTQAFLDFSRARGNDLVTPTGSFPGLRPGDAWCLCAERWREAVDAGVVVPARLASTEASALKVGTTDELAAGRRMSRR